MLLANLVPWKGQIRMPGLARGIGRWGTISMDATRRRRTRDEARHSWYAFSRSFRFARHLRFRPFLAEPCPGFPTHLEKSRVRVPAQSSIRSLLA